MLRGQVNRDKLKDFFTSQPKVAFVFAAVFFVLSFADVKVVTLPLIEWHAATSIVFGIIMSAVIFRNKQHFFQIVSRNPVIRLKHFSKLIKNEQVPASKDEKDEYFEYLSSLEKIYIDNGPLLPGLAGLFIVLCICLLGFFLPNESPLDDLIDMVAIIGILIATYNAFHSRLTLKRIRRIKSRMLEEFRHEG